MFGGDLAVITYKDAGNVRDPAEADQVMWGQSPAQWSALYGMLRDRFGVVWVIDVASVGNG
ncbi:hypothetical protein [Nonomuraea sp. B5E05]|uniref:hypothetical protein n=1 Tax=Nonomuraea sp. B5E05 TaxID=3153569 RepID=UPI003260EC41